MYKLSIDTRAILRDIEKFDRSLFRSNLFEVVAAVFVIMIFLSYAYIFKDKPVLLPIGSFLIACGGLFIILYIIKNRIRKGESPSKQESLDYFMYWKSWYENTYKLSKNIFWWYLLPVIPGFITFTIGMAQSRHGRFLQTSLKLGILALITGAFVYWLNKYYISKKLKKRIGKLNSLIFELESN